MVYDGKIQRNIKNQKTNHK